MICVWNHMLKALTAEDLAKLFFVVEEQVDCLKKKLKLLSNRWYLT